MDIDFTNILFLFSKTSGHLCVLDCRPYSPIQDDGQKGRYKNMCEVIKPLPNEIIIFNNFRALEEAIDEISQTENIRNEREFFESYRIKIMKLD